MPNKDSLKGSSIVVINRGFWPASDVPGESLLVLSELLSRDCKTFVLTQSNEDVESRCRERGRAVSVQIRSCSSLTDSSSNILLRVIEGIYFASWISMQLLLLRPKIAYVATDPPLIIPFIVAIYCKLFGSRFIYHVQDIHPEASSLILNMPAWLMSAFRRLDNITLSSAASVITLTPEMVEYVRKERGISTPIYIVDNASAYPNSGRQRIKNTMVFCGNAGRMQEIPLLISAIELYLSRGGSIKFSFLGAGLYVNRIIEISNRHEGITYLGYLPLHEAIEVLSEHEWGLLPINTNILKFAFPSKASAYVAAGCKILAICENESSLARWIYSKKRGLVASPDIESIVNTFFKIERGECVIGDGCPSENPPDYSFGLFAAKLRRIIENY